MSTYEEKMLRRLATLAPDSDTLRRLLENATPVPWAPVEHGSGPAAWTVETDDGTVVVEVHDGDDHPGSLEVAGVDARLIAAAPALAAEVLRLRAERDELRAVCDELRAVCDDLYVDADRANGARDAACAAARAHLAADDAFAEAWQTDADVRSAEALAAAAARECLAGLVGYAAGDATRYITTSRPGAVIEVQEHRLSPEERKALDFGRKPFGGGL